MKAAFNEASYLAQVRRLHGIARAAISKYPLKVASIKLINHGENTTFRVAASSGRQYMLRVHRDGYHTSAAIREELSWLAHLAEKRILVPKPVPSKKGNLMETAAYPDVPGARNCALFEWLDGRFIGKAVSPLHLYQLGTIIADLQTHAPRTPRQRRYWTAAGLVGVRPKLGEFDALPGIRRNQQVLITQTRKMVLAKLRRFEQKFPKRQGLIHADLHLGNVLLFHGGRLAAIDFDDCGYGFHAYDLAIPLISVRAVLGDQAEKRLPEFKDALLAGYTTKKAWDSADEEVLRYLFMARRLAMLGWLNSRSDNPRLKKYLAGAVKSAIEHIKQEFV